MPRGRPKLKTLTITSEIEEFRERLQDIANTDVLVLLQKDASYGSSWKKRGGVGAFMMLARKWDRIENQVQRISDKWDILAAGKHYSDAEGILDDIRDLRRYLILVESEILRDLSR